MNLKKPNAAQTSNSDDLNQQMVDHYNALVELDRARPPSKSPGLKAITADSFATMRQTLGDAGGEAGPRTVVVSGGLKLLDGLEGVFAWDPTSTARDDGSLVVNPSGDKPGRWRRIVFGALNLALSLFTSAKSGIVPASGGGTANFLRADGAWAAPPNPPSTGRLLRVTVLTGTSLASIAGCTSAIVDMWAGGGGGEAAVTPGQGGGGAAGGFGRLITSAIPATWSYVLGAAGAGGIAGGAGPTAGGDSTFTDAAVTMTVHGGPAGPGISPAVSTNATIPGSGAPGHPGVAGPFGPLIGGQGGSSSLGGGGAAQIGDAAGNAATGPASGGGGAFANGANHNGGAATVGYGVLMEFS